MSSLANALIVVDVQNDFALPAGGALDVARRIHTYIGIHNDDYKVILGTKRSPEDLFHPALFAVPDAPDPYADTNVDFDAVFYGGMHEKRETVIGESLDTYLQRHNIGHVDLAGFLVREIAIFLKEFEYSVTILVPLVVGDITAANVIELATAGIKVEGLTL